MAEINNIIIGGSYMLRARGAAPETAVKVVGVKGRWVRIKADSNGAEANVAAKDLTPIEKAPRKEGELAKNGVVDPKARARYVRNKVDGVVHIDNGDQVANTLRGMGIEDVFKAAAKIMNVSAHSLAKRWEHLNNGMQRMCVGNMLRKFYRDQAKAA